MPSHTAPSITITSLGDPERFKTLLPDVHAINRACFHHTICDYLEPALNTLIYHPGVMMTSAIAEGRTIGYTLSLLPHISTKFAHTPFKDTPAAYLAMSAVLPSEQNKNLYRKMNELRFQSLLDAKCDHVYVRTQNPKVLYALQSLFNDFIARGKLLGMTLVYSGTELIHNTLSQYEHHAPAAKQHVEISSPEPYQHIMHNLNTAKGEVGLFLWALLRP